MRKKGRKVGRKHEESKMVQCGRGKMRKKMRNDVEVRKAGRTVGERKG